MPNKASILHLGCGTNYRADAVNVDAVEEVSPDIIHDLDVTPWPFDDDCFETVIAEHVVEHLTDTCAALEEIYRVLQPGGTARIVVPVGVDAVSDPTHKATWTWRTPEFYSGSRHWDVDTGLDVDSRVLRLWSLLPGRLGRVHSHLLRFAARNFTPNEWAFALPLVSGEFSVIFRKPGGSQ